jgi:hypothetical protein
VRSPSSGRSTTATSCRSRRRSGGSRPPWIPSSPRAARPVKQSAQQARDSIRPDVLSGPKRSPCSHCPASPPRALPTARGRHHPATLWQTLPGPSRHEPRGARRGGSEDREASRPAACRTAVFTGSARPAHRLHRPTEAPSRPSRRHYGSATASRTTVMAAAPAAETASHRIHLREQAVERRLRQLRVPGRLQLGEHLRQRLGPRERHQVRVVPRGPPRLRTSATGHAGGPPRGPPDIPSDVEQQAAGSCQPSADRHFGGEGGDRGRQGRAQPPYLHAGRVGGALALVAGQSPLESRATAVAERPAQYKVGAGVAMRLASS